MVEHLLKEENNRRILKYMFLGLAIFCMVLIAATTGLTYAMVLALKDTEVGRMTAFAMKDNMNILTMHKSESKTLQHPNPSVQTAKVP